MLRPIGICVHRLGRAIGSNAKYYYLHSYFHREGNPGSVLSGLIVHTDLSFLFYLFFLRLSLTSCNKDFALSGKQQ